MTLSSTKSTDSFEGNGSTTLFQIDFMFLRDEDVEVLLRDEAGAEHVQALGTDYQLTGAGSQAGGACVMTVAPAEGQSLHLRRNPAMVQETDYPENDAFPAASHEAALDYLTMICQSLSERLDRTITFRVSSAVGGVTLPEPDADRVLAWNAAGDNLENKDVLAAGGILVPLSVNQGGTGADNVTEALFNLGFGAAGAAIASCESGDEAAAVINPDILKADTADLLQAVYGDEAQVSIANNLNLEPSIARNHILWSPDTTGSVRLGNGVPWPYDGTYVIHLYPGTATEILLGSEYKLPLSYEDPNPSAGEIRIVVEKFNGRVSIISIQNMEA
ncbi:MAG: hypothetical protein H0S80_13545 [Desulfovibrionaceae bacterium]|nr:hypothetical protein [Desulfovibrionaceae bacterium]